MKLYSVTLAAIQPCLIYGFLSFFLPNNVLLAHGVPDLEKDPPNTSPIDANVDALFDETCKVTVHTHGFECFTTRSNTPVIHSSGLMQLDLDDQEVEKHMQRAKQLIRMMNVRSKPLQWLRQLRLSRENKMKQLRALYFIFAKGIDKEIVFLPEEVSWQLVKNIATPSIKLRRLLRLSEPTEGDYHRMDKAPEKIQTFDMFVSLIPEWGDPTLSYVFHRDHPKVNRPGQPNCLVQRYQSSGLCYLHAPVTLQHYLVAMGTETPEVPVPMVDLTNWLRMENAKTLYDHIFHDGGGSSLKSLKRLLTPESKIRFFEFHSKRVDQAFLEEWGPMLVSNFMVRPEFQDRKRFQYLGPPNYSQNVKGGHAMVLIGTREDEQGHTRYLLQNWWAGKQFVEVDHLYLEGSDAFGVFTKTQQVCIPAQNPTTLSFFAETDIDSYDRMPPEQFAYGDNVKTA